MFLVGGGIIRHGIPMLHDTIDGVGRAARRVPLVGDALETLVSPVLDGAVGILAGAVVLAVVAGAGKLLRLR